MDKQKLEVDISVFINEDDHAAYDREQVEVHLQFPLGDVFESFPKEGHYFGLENKKLEEINHAMGNNGMWLEAIYTGSTETIVRTSFGDDDKIEIVEEDLEDAYEYIKVYRNTLWERPARGVVNEEEL